MNHTSAYRIHVHVLGVRMRMMPRAVSSASVSMCIGARRASVRIVHSTKRTIPGLWRLSSTCFLLLSMPLHTHTHTQRTKDKRKELP